MLFDEYASIKNKTFQIMDKDGKVLNKKAMPKLSKETLLDVYKGMTLSRQYDEWMLKWQRQGRTYGFLSTSGQEALQIACAMHLRKGIDWLAPAFRSVAAWLWLGWDADRIMTYWSGNENGSVMPDGTTILPVSIPIATQCSHAVGLAYAAKYQKKDSIVLTYIGDGGTSEGEFSEAMNNAGVLKLPVIFVIQNNRWALSTPNEEETAATSFAQKGIGAGLKTIIVDGNDFFAAYQALEEAVKFAKSNQPVVIEFRTYRMGDHSTSDDSKVYRTADYVKKMLATEPLIRFTNYLKSQKILTDDIQAKIKSENEASLKASFAKATKDKEDITLRDIFKYTYEEMTPELERQYNELNADLEQIKKQKLS